MFMCLTYTGDLLADVFISGYSKMVNFLYRQVCRGRLKSCVPDEARRSFEHPDVIFLHLIEKRNILSLFFFVSSSLKAKKHVMFRSLLLLLYLLCISVWVPYSLLNGKVGLY